MSYLEMVYKKILHVIEKKHQKFGREDETQLAIRVVSILYTYYLTIGKF